MIISQMQSQSHHPDLTLTITSGVGTFRRTATLHGGTWQGHDITHPFDDHRSHIPYDETARPPMAQEEYLYMTPQSAQPSTLLPTLSSNQGILPTPPPPPLIPQRVTFVLPVIPSAILTPPPPLPQSSTMIHSLAEKPPTFLPPSSFQEEGVSSKQGMSRDQNGLQATESQDKPSTSRTVVFKDSYEVLASPVATDQQEDNSPPLIGHQEDAKLKERQKQQQRTENQAIRAPLDLRNKLEQLAQKKRATEQANRSAKQPVARKVMLSTELISRAETEQLDLTAKDAVRLQR